MAHENRIHAAIGLAFAPGQLIVRVCRGVLLSTIEQTAPGIVECELAEPLGDDAIVTCGVEPPPPPFYFAQIMRQRLTATRWRFACFVAGPADARFHPVAFDAAWFGSATGSGPVATIPVP